MNGEAGSSCSRRAGSWLQFDDDKVTVTSEDEITKLYGGGDWHTAYVTLYRAIR